MEIRALDRTALDGPALPALRALLTAAYPRHVFDEAMLRWRFAGAPAPVVLNVAAFDGETMIGHAALAPRRLRVGDAELWAGQSLGSAVHPAAQRRGLYTEMAHLLYALAFERGIDLCWGFPNANSHYGRRAKLDWQDISEIPTKRLDLSGRGRPAVRTAAALRPLAISDLRPGQPPPMATAVFERSPAYLTWRFAAHPRNVYRALAIDPEGEAYVLVKPWQSPAGLLFDIVDLWAPDAERAEALLGGAVADAAAAGAVAMEMWMNTHHPFALVAERLGFRNTAPVTYFAFHRTLATRAEPARSALADYRNWYLVSGDSDVY